MNEFCAFLYIKCEKGFSISFLEQYWKQVRNTLKYSAEQKGVSIYATHMGKYFEKTLSKIQTMIPLGAGIISNL